MKLPAWTVGDVIRKARLDLGLKQEALALKADVSVTALIRLERESDKSERATIERVAHALNLPLSTLYRYVEQSSLFAELTEGQQARVVELARQFVEKNRTARNHPPVQPTRPDTARAIAESAPPISMRRRK